MAERWLPVVGYEGLYYVSNKGRVRAVARRTSAGGILSPIAATSYLSVHLIKDGKRIKHPIHRLVAFAFLGNPPTKKHQVNHKDAVKTNNSDQNLEWVTAQENTAHAIAMGLMVGSYSRRHPIIRNDGVAFESMAEASRAMSVPQCLFWKAIKHGRPVAGFTFVSAKNL